MANAHQVNQYYEQLQATPIGQLVRELLPGRITQETGNEWACDCPNHKSISKTSLKIDLMTNRWHCWGCGVGGAPLQLVEFVQQGVCSTKQKGKMPQTHREARDFLAQRCGLQPLSQLGKTREEIARAEKAFLQREACLDTLGMYADGFHQQLLKDEKALEWVQQNYGLSLETIKQQKIGLANYQGESSFKALKEKKGIERLAAISTGLFGLNENNDAFPILRGRVVFPYWKGGRIVFMIGRILPWDPAIEKQPKYKKLLVHDPAKRTWINPCIDNSAFFNEDCLRNHPDHVLITEGVTDCIAAMQHGFAAISPVTVQFREKDIPRLVTVLRGCKQLFLCLDNELSHIGLKSALKLAKQLEEKKIYAKIISLPLGESEQKAREELNTQFGIRSYADYKNLKTQIADPTPEREAEVQRLIAESKIDLNGWFAQGHTAEDFQKVMAEAKPRIEILIRFLDTRLDDQGRYEQRQPLMVEIAKQPEYYLDRCLKMIQEHYGKRSITINALRSELRKATKVAKKEIRSEHKHQAIQNQMKKLDPHSCRAAMLRFEMQFAKDEPVPLEELGEVVANWLKANRCSVLLRVKPRACHVLPQKNLSPCFEQQRPTT